jgi:uncharacterized membrane protein
VNSLESKFERNEKRRKRVRWIDALRGFTIVNMILYHAMWDAVYLRGVPAPWYVGAPGYVWQQGICWTFILLSGFCWKMDKRPLRRGIEVSLAGILITVVTGFFQEESIQFGVLTLIGACILLMIPLERVLRHIPKYPGCALSFWAFFLFRNINDGCLGFEKIRLWTVPDCLYRNPLTTFLGFPEKGFYSTDYFSLIPWFFLFCAGYFMFRVWKERFVSWDIPEKRFLILSLLGRNSLLIYLLHQPVLMLLFWCVP